jgi:hypothetical protein
VGELAGEPLDVVCVGECSAVIIVSAQAPKQSQAHRYCKLQANGLKELFNTWTSMHCRSVVTGGGCALPVHSQLEQLLQLVYSPKRLARVITLM